MQHPQAEPRPFPLTPADEQQYRLVVEASPYCIHQIGLDGRLLSMNPAGLDMLELSLEQVLGTHKLDYVAKRDRHRVAAEMDAAFAGASSQAEFEATNGLVFLS